MTKFLFAPHLLLKNPTRKETNAMREYVAVVKRKRNRRPVIFKLLNHQDAAAALEHLAIIHRKEILGEDTHTIVICPVEDEQQHVAALTKEPGV
jgi:hypothetical protein